MAKSTVSLECSHCNKTFLKKTAQFNSAVKRRNQKLFFCSQSCTNLSRELPNRVLQCKFCGEKFIRTHANRQNIFCNHSCSAKYNNKQNAKNRAQTQGKPSQCEEQKVRVYKEKKIKQPRPITFRCIFQCTCGKTVLRTKVHLRKSKSGDAYCSKSCRMTHHNLSGVVPRASFLVSSEEHILFNLIQADFPELKVERNCRNILPSGLELDLFIPSLNVAIELNGPVHFFPIYGSERFAKVQDKDIKKQMETSALGIDLIVIDISKSKSKKRTLADLTVYYNTYIKPILI